MKIRTGIGFDVHPLKGGEPLVLGGVRIPFEKGLDGHSDGDVLIHSIIDAIFGGAGQGDIGTHFPSEDARYKGIDSTKLLCKTLEIITEESWRVSYVDASIIAERPVLKSYISQMRQVIAKCLDLEDLDTNVKATTTDGIGFVGRGEGVASMAVVTMESDL